MQADKAGDRPKLKVCVEESVQGQELGRERQSQCKCNGNGVARITNETN